MVSFVVMMVLVFGLVALSLKDDEGLTRPGAKRVRLWRDRGGPGGVPRTRVKRLLPFVPQGSQNPKNLLFTDHRKVLNTIYGTNSLILALPPSIIQGEMFKKSTILTCTQKSRVNRRSAVPS